VLSIGTIAFAFAFMTWIFYFCIVWSTVCSSVKRHSASIRAFFVDVTSNPEYAFSSPTLELLQRHELLPSNAHTHGEPTQSVVASAFERVGSELPRHSGHLDNAVQFSDLNCLLPDLSFFHVPMYLRRNSKRAAPHTDDPPSLAPRRSKQARSSTHVDATAPPSVDTEMTHSSAGMSSEVDLAECKSLSKE